MKLPIAENDPMLDAMDAAQEAAQTKEKRRPYLGMSSLGNECVRQQWYGFRWVKKIKAVPGVEMQTQDAKDPTRQIGWKDFGGHLRGHADGILTGLKQAPKTKHLWECKAVNDKKFAKLEKLKAADEKSALSIWDPTYYAQQVLYMDYEGLTRSWMTTVTPGGRKQIGVRTEANPAEAMKLKAKAERIIFSEEAPEPFSTVDKAPPCLFCDHKELCRGREAAERNCRTCAHVTPEKDGTWSCARFKHTLDYDMQTVGCISHRYNPSLVPGEVTDASADENWIEYTMNNGSIWRDEL